MLGGRTSIPNYIPAMSWAHKSPLLLSIMGTLQGPSHATSPNTQMSQAARVFPSSCEVRALRRDKGGKYSGTIQMLCKYKL